MNRAGLDAPNGGGEGLRLAGTYTRAGDIEIGGDPGALTKLADRLENETEASAILLIVPEGTSLDHYDGFLTSILVERIGDLVHIDLRDSTLVITGSIQNLQTLAENIRWLAQSIEGEETESHLHIDYHPGHSYLAASSKSLVLAVKKEPGRVV